MGSSLYELTLYVSVPQDKADYLLEKLCDTVEDYGYGWERTSCRVKRVVYAVDELGPLVDDEFGIL